VATDKDRPSTWLRYRNGLCQTCVAACCTMPVEVKTEDLIRLGLTDAEEITQSPRKVLKRLQKAKQVLSYRESTGLWMLASRPNGDCHFLHPQTRLCTVYEQRPGVCREFPSIGPRPGFCPARTKEP